MSSDFRIPRAPSTRLCRAPLMLAFFSCCWFGALAGAQADAKAVPAITGDYVLTDTQVCSSNNFGPVLISALASFNSTTGKAKLVGSIASGSPMVLAPLKQTLSYSNSQTTVTLGETVYQVIYGKLDNGTATYLSMIAVDDPCAAEIVLSRQ